MNAQALADLIRAQRSKRVEVAPGKWVSVLRPTEFEVQKEFIKVLDDGSIGLQADIPGTVKYVVGWEGFLESDLVGSAGASSPAEFSPGLWALVASDNVEWATTIAKHLLNEIATHQIAKADAAKNSQPS